MPMTSQLRGPLTACVLALTLLLQPAVHAQDAAARTLPRSGDAWLDAVLPDIDRYAARYPEAFADELVRYDAAPRALVETLLADPHWTAGDIYFACALGKVAGQPCRAVAQRWQQDPASGWAAIAQGFGVAPDSSAFHRLKRDIVLSYQRWARPLQVDPSLHAEFPKLPVATSPASASGSPQGAAPVSQPAKPSKGAAKRKGKSGV
jgi:hypothetical protein